MKVRFGPKSLKPFFRVVAFDDGSFKPKSSGEKTCLIGVVFRQPNHVEAVLSTDVEVDGFDSTEKIVTLLRGSRFLEQVSFVLLNGVNFAGFNVVDLPQLHAKLKKPIIAVFRKTPNMKKIKLALQRLPDAKKRLQLIEKAGKIHKAEAVNFQCRGIDAKLAHLVLRKLCVHAKLPEPLRLAHLIASGVSLGESTRP